ncbi:MAG: hypothetical protein V4489_00370 [Chlamydiota bacterium]
MTLLGEEVKVPLREKLSSSIVLGEYPLAGYLSLSKDGPIDNTTYLYVKYALEEFRKQKVAFVLLDLDSPGGEVFSALRIVEELRKMDEEHKIAIVALVDDWALSAGALLAYSCRFIGATSSASMGAAEPVTVSSDGSMQTASEKMISALRVEFAKTAELYGRDPLIAEAMVDKDKVLVIRQGKVTSLLEDSQILPSDQIITTKGKLLTLDAKQMIDLSVADFKVPAGGVLSGQTTLEKEPFFTESIQWISYSNWKIAFFSFLSHPLVSSLLMLGMMLGLYGEVQNPGWGFSAILGIFCLFFIILSAFATQLVGSLEIILAALGLLLLLIDLLFIGFGFLGGFGLLLFFGGLIAMLLPSLNGESFSLDPTGWGIVLSEWAYRLSFFLAVIFLGLIFCVVLSRFFWRKSIFARKLILKQVKEEKLEVEYRPARGTEGEAFSALRPFGKVMIEGRLYEAETEGEMIYEASKIVVVDSSKRTLLVREMV